MHNIKILASMGEWYELDQPILTDDELSNSYHYSIWAAPHTIRPFYPVIKIYYGNFIYNNILISYLKESKMCRIRMDKPEYVGLSDEDLILTKELKEKFINYVSKNWYNCVDMMNDAAWHVCCKDKNFMSFDTPIPDYSKLETAD